MHRERSRDVLVAIVLLAGTITAYVAFAADEDALKPAPSENDLQLAAKYILDRPRLEDGMTVLARHLAAHPNDPEGLYLLAAGQVRQGKTAEAVATLEKALKAGLPAERVATSAAEYLQAAKDDPAVKKLLDDRLKPLRAGPMVGSVTDASAKFWVRADGKRNVQVVAATDAKLTEPVKSDEVTASPEKDNSAVASLAGLKARTKYFYDVLIDGKGQLGPEYPSFSTYPAPGTKGTTKIAFGGGARFVPEREGIWDTIAAAKADAMLFLGDNLYMDVPGKPDVQRAHYYRRQTRPEFRRMTAGTPIYAIYDDHDFGANDSKGGNDPDKPAWKRQSLAVFQENWANPAYGGGKENPGCWFDVVIGDVHVFMLDQRYYWDVKAGMMLGAAQKKWLLEKLAASKATYKVLASGTLWTEHADKGGADSWESVAAEREEIFDVIRKNRIGGVVLISADRHRTEIWKLQREGLYPLYEFESSKLTNIHTHGGDKGQTLWTYNKGNFFGLLTFDSGGAAPSVTFEAVDAGGKVLHALKVPLSEISFK